ncbi:MAG: dUTP diphosphatase [Solobacterium sp.]|nr:dUTP diphosphatase [Solobacterium sp.]
MEKAARFMKVSLDRFRQSLETCAADRVRDAEEILDSLPLPERATAGSAGYDFRMPYDLRLAPGEEALVPTGIRAEIDEGYVLLIMPRSSLGFRYRLQLDNTVGVIDSDYFNAENEGHIMCRMINDSRTGKVLELRAGDRFVQGIFLKFGICHDDEAADGRTGGFGSTGR